MSKYTVLRTCRAVPGGPTLIAGAEVDSSEKGSGLTEAAVKKLPDGYVEKAGAGKSAPAVKLPLEGDALQALAFKAIEKLDPENEDHVTGSGSPNVNALEKEMRQLDPDHLINVSAKERDQIWDAYQAAHPDLFKDGGQS